MAIKKSKEKLKPVLESKKVKVASVKKKRAVKPLEKLPTQTIEEVTRQINATPVSAVSVAKRTVRSAVSSARAMTQFNFMKAPATEHAFAVGDNVEVFCDHEKNRERIRGWIKGIVVQVDNKLVAVQFRSNVFLTDGWMVPDKILWYSLSSEHIRPMLSKKATVKKDFVIPDY